MLHKIKRLLKDRRGNALVIAGAALPLVVGSAGLATDTIQWVTWKRQLQRAADSAAFAGVYALSQSSSADTAVATDLVNNQHAPVTLRTGYPQIAYPTSTTYDNAVQVTLSIQKRLGFSSMFLSAAPIITVNATAAMVDDGEYCLRGLRRDAVAAIQVGGSSSASLGCKAMSNSRGNPSVVVNGNSYRFETTGVAGAATLPPEITGTATADLDPYHMPMPDPFEGKYPTSVPSGTSCTNFNQHQSNVGTGQNRTYRLSPGCYNDFKITGSETYALDPGVYYLNATDFEISGSATLTGTGVTIILTGSTPGSVQTNGNANINLTAPTTGTYAKMLFIQAAGATVENNNTINGSSTSSYDGAFYFPKGNVNFNGSSGNMTKCAMVVAYTVIFNGNTNLQNNVTGCSANMTVKGKEIRLVA